MVNINMNSGDGGGAKQKGLWEKYLLCYLEYLLRTRGSLRSTANVNRRLPTTVSLDLVWLNF